MSQIIKIFFLTWRYLFRGNAKHLSFISLVSCLGIALGVATLIVVISVMNGFDQDLTERLLRFNSHLTIENFNHAQLKEIGLKVEQYPQVLNVTRQVQTQIFVLFDGVITPIIVKGIEFDKEKVWSKFSGYIKQDNSEKGFFVGEGLWQRYLIHDQFEYYPLKDKLVKEKQSVRGVFKIGLYDVDNGVLIGNYNDVLNLSPNHSVSLSVETNNPFDVVKIKRRILEEFNQEVFVTTWMEANQTLFSALKLEKIAMFIILSLIVLVASFNIFASLTVKVVEKTKDIGVLNALGFSRRSIMVIFGLQGVFLGILGVGIGAGIGVGLCFIIAKYPFITLPQEIYYIEYLPVAFDWFDLGIIMAVGICISVLSSIMPALRASRLTASDALRYE